MRNPAITVLAHRIAAVTVDALALLPSVSMDSLVEVLTELGTTGAVVVLEVLAVLALVALD
jgi:hypothetical protein